MFKIGEFSKLTQVSIRMLRYYDEAGLLKPASTDPWTGYRMYSADQIPTLRLPSWNNWIGNTGKSGKPFSQNRTNFKRSN